MKYLITRFSLLGLAGILVSCVGGSWATQASGTLAASSPNETTTSSPALTPSLGPGSTMTSIPSSTPDVSLYEDGAWLFFQGWALDDGKLNSHLWTVNWDGTGLTDLLPGFYVYQYKVQPAVNGSPGRYVAAITSYGQSDKFMFTLAHLPDGEVVANIPLTNSQTELIDMPSTTDPSFKDYQRRLASSMSVSDLRSLAWSADGAKIAFSGAQDGTQTDVYIYSLEDSSISRLTQGQHPHHASNLLWSPDGQYIAYDDISCATVIYCVDSIWVVREDGSTVKRIASVDEWPRIGDLVNRPQKLGWTSGHTLAVYALRTNGFALYRLKQIDVDTGKSSIVFQDEYCGAAFAPEKNIWLIEGYSVDGGEAYLIQDGIMNKLGPLACCLPAWSPVLNAFVTPQGLVGIDGNQIVMALPKSPPLISPNGAYWAYPRSYGNVEPEEKLIAITEDVLWIGEIGQQPRQLSNAPLEVLQWSSNSRSVLVTDNKEWIQYVAMAPDFELRPISQYDTNQSFGPWWDGEAIDK